MTSELKPCAHCGCDAYQKSRFDIICPGCGIEVNGLPGQVEDIWNSRAESPEVKGLIEASKDFIDDWSPSQKPSNFNSRNEYYQTGDEDRPFFTEAYLYPLLGKHDARVLLGKFNSLVQALAQYEKGREHG